MNSLFRSFYYLLTIVLGLTLFFRCGDSDNNQNDYPSNMVKDDTNLDPGDNMPMDIGAAVSAIEKQQLLALLMRQKTNMHYRIEELKNMPGDAFDNTVVRGDIDKLRKYMTTLDQEIVNVRMARGGAMEEVSEAALGTIKAAGALMQSSVIRIDRGF